MTTGQIKLLTTLGVIIVALIMIFIIVFIIWRIIEIPIRSRDKIFEERDQARNELQQIQAAKGVEWDKYKELENERDKIRNAYIKEKETHEKLKDDVAKLKVHNDNLSAVNKELKKEHTNGEKIK